MEQTAKANKLARNALSGMAATIIYMVSRLLLTPLVLQYLSLEEFGLWSLSFIILSYAGMGGFGVNSTYIRYSARYLAEGRETEISKLLSTGVAYMFAFSLLFCTLLFLVMPFILDRFHIQDAQKNLASTVFLGTAAVFSLELTLGGFRFILNGLHEFAREKMVTTVAGLLEIAAILSFLAMGAGVKGLLYAFAFRLFLETAGCWFIARSILPSLRISYKLMSREHFRLFTGFGGKVQVLGMLGIFLAAIDRLFITAISGLAAGGMFEVGRKLPSTAGGIASSAFGPFLSTAAHHEGNWTGERENTVKERISTYLLIVATTIAVALPPVFLLEPLGEWLPLHGAIPALSAAALSIVLLLLLRKVMLTDNRLESGELKALYLNGIRFTNMISSTLFIFLIAMAHPLIDAWVGSGFATAAQVMVFLSIAYPVQLGTGPVTMIFRGIDRNGRELEYMLVQVVFMLIWIPAASFVWGLTGSAASIAASSLLSTSYLFWRSNATFRIGYRKFITHTIFPALVPLLPAVIVYAVSNRYPVTGRVQSVLQVLLCGGGYLFLTVALFWTVVLDGEEKTKALELLPFSKPKRSSC
ncbi:MAG: polysaccharide biosynthesis protein [Chlorobiaceae bacterium]|nr:polysaccharide biosynthesis protein [Chlorobiaceae bacterium]NTW74089.1 polysaccharide biosynthesis protein [Chlorobiaceae bacterium]